MIRANLKVSEGAVLLKSFSLGETGTYVVTSDLPNYASLTAANFIFNVKTFRPQGNSSSTPTVNGGVTNYNATTGTVTVETAYNGAGMQIAFSGDLYYLPS